MADCGKTVGPDFHLDENGNPIDPNTENKQGCSERPNGNFCPETSKDLTCKPFQLTENRDSCIIDNYVNEALNIAGAELNIYKMLGVHEQNKLIDCTGNGVALSNGDAIGFPVLNAFDVFATEWRSIQTGTGVLASSYLGYDFGEIKTLDRSRNVYGVDTSIFKHITAFSIKQSSSPNYRATRVRVERSQDGLAWYGVGIAVLPDDDCLNTVLIKHSVPSRYWRIRPLDFNGSTSDRWGVQALQLFHEYQATHDYNIQDKIFLENRDRDYSEEPIRLKGYYDLIDVQSEISQFVVGVPSQILHITINFSACVELLGRPIVIGDIIEIPSEAQYSSELRKILKWMEVTDTGWSTEGYTPGWQPTMLRIIAEPAFASQETQDIFGDLAEQPLPDELGLMDKGDGNNPNYQDYSDIEQAIQAEAKDMVPEKGREGSSTIRAWEEEEVQAAADQGLPHLQRIGLHPTALYVEDAMPPNQAPFTEGTEYPTSPMHGDYHRLTYEGLSKDIPARLYRYSSAKGRWIFLEKDKRAQFDPVKPTLQEFLTSPNKRHLNEITRDRETIDDECEE